MVIYVFILICQGIGLSQVISSHRGVTLKWLRLGDLIALPILSIAIFIFMKFNNGRVWTHTVLVIECATGLGIVFHLILVQLAKRIAQRVVLCGFICGVVLYTFFVCWYQDSSVIDIFLKDLVNRDRNSDVDAAVSVYSWLRFYTPLVFVLSAWLVGGSIMTMLLGHAYLTAGNEMTQRPFMRLAKWLAGGIILRLLLAIFMGLIPWWLNREEINSEQPQLWITMMITVRFLAGLFIPAIMVFMVIECIKIRANQSATGILYIVGILLLIGELTSISISQSTGWAF